jgi:uncharacterized membrane protein YhaH (DUF805 family)
MGMQEAISRCFSNYVGFEGRAARPEYWWWVLFIIVVAVVLQILAVAIGSLLSLILGLFFLATFLPGLAVTARRLHDVDKSGWWMLIALIPIFGTYWLLFLLVQPGTMRDPTPVPNQFGPPASP